MSRAPWLVFAATVSINVLTYVLLAFDAMTADEPVVSTMSLIIGFVGALVASKQRQNLIGWVFLLLCFTLTINTLALGYAEAAETNSGLEGANYAAWLGEWLTIIWITLAASFVPLLFPTGRPLTPRWRLVVWLAIIATGLSATSTALRPGPIAADVPSFVNPVGITGTREFFELLISIGDLAAAATFVLACVSLVLRFRRSSGKERLQMKWFTLVALFMGIFIMMSVAQLIIDGDGSTPWLNTLGTIGWFGFIAMLGLGLPITVGVAILNHRLFDIDRLINRTIVYVVLTAGLAATYAGLVIGLQALLRPLSGGSDLALVITTLTVAALFLPARHRVQETVDRRFNRQAYNAAHTVEQFSTRLREQIDLDTLRYELLATVDETMQPATANVWLRREAGA